MKPNYTDDQLERAIVKAAERGSVVVSMDKGDDWVAEFELQDLRRILANLPDQQDDWKECGFLDIRKGDRVRVRDDEGNFLEFTVKYIGEKRLYWQQKHYDDHISFDHANGIWRLHRPVEHPDPAEHPVIIVHESTVLPKGSEPQKTIFIRPYYRNDIWNGAPDTITEWEPASIVPKVAEDDR